MIAAIKNSHRLWTITTALIALAALGVAVVALGLAYSQQHDQLTRIHNVVNQNQKASDKKQAQTNRKFCAVLNAVAPPDAPPPTTERGRIAENAIEAYERQIGCPSG